VKPEAIDSAQIMEVLGALRQELARLSNRVAALERGEGREVRDEKREAAPDSPIASRPSPLEDELIAVIGAAIAAFLGKKARIRQIRLLGTTSWAQQGRVTIQASHGLSVHHG